VKSHDINEQRMMAHYVEQLNKLGFYDTDGMGYLELKQKLAVERMRNIDYESPANQYF